MEVIAAVLHRIDKRAGDTIVHLDSATSELAVDDTVRRVATQVRGLYKRGVVYGAFEPDEENYRFQPYLRDYVACDEGSFFDFSVKSVERLRAEMVKTPASAGGYIMFVRYTEQGDDYLFVLMLNNKIGASVGDDLTLEKSIHLDLDKLYVAARINITRWEIDSASDEPGKHKYVSFIRGRREVSGYFTNFIGCTEVVRSVEATDLAIKIINDYSRDNSLSTEKKEQNRQIAHDYFKKCFEEKREASIERLSLLLDENEPDKFLEYASNEEYGISGYFEVDKSRLARLRGVIYNSTALKIRMTENFVRNHVDVDENGSITLKQIPDELLREVQALK